MSPEKVADLREGDRILVEMVVDYQAERTSYVGAYLAATGAPLLLIDGANIHSIISKCLNVGDIVTYDEHDIGIIITIFDKWALVKWDNHPMPEVYFLSDLHYVKKSRG